MALAKDIDPAKTASGAPELRITPMEISGSFQNTDKMMEALHVPDEYRPDAVWKGKVHQKRNGTGSLRFMLVHERRLRALSSSEEEFRKRNTPSNSNVWVTYNRHGIYLFAALNHSSYRTGIRRDNDLELWKDECMEFFFRTPQKHSYQLIVNSSDAKVMLKDGLLADGSRIKIVSRLHNGAAGGYAQEIMIPWSVFDLEEKPEPGTTWAFNVCREFHSWRQYTSWARVESSFLENSRWGILKFSSPQGHKFLQDINPKRLYPGANVITGVLSGNDLLKVTLSDPSGKIIAEERLDMKKRKILFPVRILPGEKMKHFLLTVKDLQNRLLETEGIPVISEEVPVTFKSPLVKCASGDVISMIAELNVSQMEIQKDDIIFQLVDPDGKLKYELKPIRPIENQLFQIWLKTTGILPGEYRLVPKIPGQVGKLFKHAGGINIIVYPAFAD